VHPVRCGIGVVKNLNRCRTLPLGSGSVWVAAEDAMVISRQSLFRFSDEQYRRSGKVKNIGR
jgi:hypothetical protein